jgi:hypothetical protein
VQPGAERSRFRSSRSSIACAVELSLEFVFSRTKSHFAQKSTRRFAQEDTMQSNSVHDLVVVPNHSTAASGSPATAVPGSSTSQGAFFGGIAEHSAEYELRLLDARGLQVQILKFRRSSDESARRFILGVRDDYDRYELWRGMQMIDSGGRLIIR